MAKPDHGPMLEPEIVEIVWVDATPQAPGWIPIEDIDLELPTMRTVGWLIGQSDVAYAIAQDVDLAGAYVNTYSLIPKRVVTSMHRLAIAENDVTR